MNTAAHRTAYPSNSYGLMLLLTWGVIWLAILGSCSSWPAIKQFGIEKAERLIECQSQNIASAETARACLGQHARDLGTQTCKQAEAWLETLPTEDDKDAAGE